MGGPNLYGESVKLAMLDANEGSNTYTINDFNDELGFDVTIDVLSINGRDATIEIVSGERPEAVQDTDSPSQSPSEAVPDTDSPSQSPSQPPSQPPSEALV